MKPLNLFLAAFLIIVANSVCSAKTDTFSYEYTILGEAIAKEGYYLVEVSVLVDKKKDATKKTASQYALLGCLFKGFTVNRIYQKPIITSPLGDNIEEHINQLLAQDYNVYTTSTYPLQIVKIGKKFRITTVVLVAKDALRKNLEDAGIIRKLGL